MISIIICSINPQFLKIAKKSISNTIGMTHEFIIYDNRISNFGICKVYNICAFRANYDYLCFIHEDVLIDTKNWGSQLVSHINNFQNAGVIGIAGAMYVPKYFISWGDNFKFDRCNYWEIDDQNRFIHQSNNPKAEDFSQTVTLDGVFLFVKRNIWENYKFDEKTYKGFHLYDADFSLNIAQKYSNYVFHSIKLRHFSKGNSLSIEYCDNLKLFQKKWSKLLPFYINEAESYFIHYGKIKEAENQYNLIKRFKVHYGLITSILYFVLLNSIYDNLLLLRVALSKLKHYLLISKLTLIIIYY
jgi:hypothetical protein